MGFLFGPRGAGHGYMHNPYYNYGSYPAYPATGTNFYHPAPNSTTGYFHPTAIPVNQQRSTPYAMESSPINSQPGNHAYMNYQHTIPQSMDHRPTHSYYHPQPSILEPPFSEERHHGGAVAHWPYGDYGQQKSLYMNPYYQPFVYDPQYDARKEGSDTKYAEGN